MCLVPLLLINNYQEVQRAAKKQAETNPTKNQSTHNMKFLVSQHKAINLANVDDITISCNYLKLTTGGGLNAREVSFVYGTQENLEKLFDAVMEFIGDIHTKVFDCDWFMKTL